MHPDTCYRSVDIHGCSPRVLKSYFYTEGLTFPTGFRLPQRYVYDYELEFYIESGGSMIIEGNCFPVSKGDVVLRRPGELVQGIMPYSCYTVCIDLFDTTGKSSSTYDFSLVQPLQDHYRDSILDHIPSLTHTEFSSRYECLFDNILREYMCDTGYTSLLMKAYVLELLHLLYQDNKGCKGRDHANPYVARMRLVKEYITEHIKERILLQDLARLVEMSPNYLHRIFTDAEGMTPNRYITLKRMEKAKELLVRTPLPVSEIALCCGYETPSYFSTAFKRENGLPPGEYRDFYTRFG